MCYISYKVVVAFYLKSFNLKTNTNYVSFSVIYEGQIVMVEEKWTRKKVYLKRPVFQLSFFGPRRELGSKVVKLMIRTSLDVSDI